MSAPHPPDDRVAMPTMVSRLPTFGSRPRSHTTPSAANETLTGGSRLTNGFYHHPGPMGVNASSANATAQASVKQNGFIRVPSNWRKENETEEGGAKVGSNGNSGQNRSAHQNYSQRQQQHGSPSTSLKKPNPTSDPKGRVLTQPMTSSSSNSPRANQKSLPVSKTGSTKPSSHQTAIANGTNGTKPTTTHGFKPRNISGTIPSLRPPQKYAPRPRSFGPGSRSGSPLQNKSPSSRCYSSENLESAAPSVQLTEDDRIRSRSLTQVRRQPSPNLTTSSKANKAVKSGLREPTAPPKGSVVKSQFSEGSNRSQLLPPTALKKQLLPSNSLASKPSGISYRLSRPSIINKSRPLRVPTANGNRGNPEAGCGSMARSNSTSTTEDSPETSPEAPEAEGLCAELLPQGEVSIIGETLEDMSMSSTSSMDRNDTSQEYMDDFDNLGIGGVGLLLLSSQNEEEDSGLDQSCARFDDDKTAVNGVTKETGLCFLDDGVDWNAIQINGDQGENRLSRLPHRRSQTDFHDQGGSSLDLSPSDSCGSGGTYMWDEEGLEPLAVPTTNGSIHTNSNTTHHIGSFDSDLNSIDVLNDLESCDLEDDDLMLDDEESSLHSDGSGLAHMAQWRMRQLCWGTQDIANDNDSDLSCYKLTEDPGNKRKDSDLILDLCPTRSPLLSPGPPTQPVDTSLGMGLDVGLGLDGGLGLDVEELAEDCSAVRSQLEYLQTLLLQDDDLDDDTLTTDTLSPETLDSSQSDESQVQCLLLEMQQLRDELRSRDRTIAQLTMQLQTVPTATGRCCCQETNGRTNRQTQTSVTERESVETQTPWRERTPQILHPPGQKDGQDPLIVRRPLPHPPNPKETPPKNPNITPKSTPNPNPSCPSLISCCSPAQVPYTPIENAHPDTHTFDGKAKEILNPNPNHNTQTLNPKMPNSDPNPNPSYPNISSSCSPIQVPETPIGKIENTPDTPINMDEKATNHSKEEMEQKVDIKEKKSTNQNRSLQQPTKLRLFPGSTLVATAPKTTTTTTTASTSGVKSKMATAFSRLPKPKSY